eukprot:TRINITY_DN17713_c0_g1_i3.p1 TRINITY_DN17713_c0_g1~~TRINITY_DN17713_c0_g1_i3.p1  ORF type:complete len:647 (-),score=128.99 TRINITY_DN17713_c0_g1_i3:167-1933(-)
MVVAILLEGRTGPLQIVAKQVLHMMQLDAQEITEEMIKQFSNQIIATAERKNYSVMGGKPTTDGNRFEDASEGQFWVWEVRSVQQLKEWKSVAKCKREKRKEAKKRLYAVMNCIKYGNGKNSARHWQKLQESKSFQEIMQMEDLLQNKENLLQVSTVQIPEQVQQVENPVVNEETAMEVDEPEVNPSVQTPKKQVENQSPKKQVEKQSPKKQVKQSPNKTTNNSSSNNQNGNSIKTMSIATFFKKKVCVTSGGSKSEQQNRSPSNSQLIVNEDKQQMNKNQHQSEEQILQISECMDSLKNKWMLSIQQIRKVSKNVRGLPPPFSRSLTAKQTEQELADQIHGSGCNAAVFPTYRRKLIWHPADSDQVQFYGSCKFTKSNVVSTRSPFEKDDRIDYDAEEEEDEGEVLEGDDEEDDLLLGQDEEIDGENDGYFVPDGYFSEDEKETMCSYPDENSISAENPNNNSSESLAIRNLMQKITRAKQQKKIVVVSTVLQLEGNQNGTVFLNDEEVLKEFKMVMLDENARVSKPQAIEDAPVLNQQILNKKRKVEDSVSGFQVTAIGSKQSVSEKTQASMSILTFFNSDQNKVI